MKSKINPLSNTKQEILSLSEACEITGFSKSWMYKLTSTREIPHFKSPGGKKIFFIQSEILDWLLQNRVSISKEIDANAVEYVVKKGGLK